MTEILETPAAAIGHVAPDFDDRRHFNTLRMRPQYRISLRLGSIDELCPDAPGTPRGRQVRMQLLGYLYEPLTSANLATAFNTVWGWFQSQLLKGDHQLADELAQIVEGNQLPAPGASVRVFLPGGYCYNDNDSSVALGGLLGFPAPPAHSYNFAREQGMWDANPMLGVIPVIAKVEQYAPATGDWHPAPNATVYLQLRPPDAPAGVAAPPAARSAGTTTPPTPSATPGPAGYVQSHVTNPNGATPIDPTDPQVDNCHSVVGGHRGRAAAGEVLELRLADGTARGGFYQAHPARATPDRPPWFTPPEAAPAAIPHAIRATTNASGEAGFVFKPSRMGGDRYKLRAFVGDPTLPSDGTEPRAVSVETGTFVVWRRIRVAKYLVWDYPAGFVQPPAPPAGALNGVQRMQLRVRQMDPITLANVAAEFQKAYCDVVIEATAARHVLTAAEWTNARNHALARMTQPANINMSALVPSINTTPCMFPLASITAYNAAVAGSATFPQLTLDNSYWRTMNSVIDELVRWFAHHFSDGALPFVVLQAPFGDALTYAGTVPANQGQNGMLTTSGQATSNRGVHLWWGRAFYNIFSYDLDHNTVHEMGHCHYGPHSWTSVGAGGLSGGFSAEHDRHDRCVMGYLAMPGDFCGRCLLRLRGWDVAAIPAN